MLNFTCPSCLEDNEVDSEDMPNRSCDDMEYECPHCTQEMTIGWIAEIEVRSVTVERGDIDYDFFMQ